MDFEITSENDSIKESDKIESQEENLEQQDFQQEIEEGEEVEEKLDQKTLTWEQSEDSLSATYTFQNENHTLGNLLRFFLMKNPDVSFAGYSITHPSENIMKLRIQGKGQLKRKKYSRIAQKFL